MELEYDPAQPLDLKISLLMGQAFRWRPVGEWFSGVVRGQLIRVRQVSPGLLEFHSSPGPDDFVAKLLRDYLRLDADILAIYRELSVKDRKMEELIQKYSGLRVLRQEPWECLISYILSSRSPIPRIERNVCALAQRFGDKIHQRSLAFPSPSKLASAELVELEQIVTGLKRYSLSISKASQKIIEGSLDIEGLTKLPHEQGRNKLLACHGVGPKVADCVALFSLGHAHAFPIDTWIGKALVDEYFPGQKPPQTHELEHWADLFKEHFGRYAGYADQFLFYDKRGGNP